MSIFNDTFWNSSEGEASGVPTKIQEEAGVTEGFSEEDGDETLLSKEKGR